VALTGEDMLSAFRRRQSKEKENSRSSQSCEDSPFFVAANTIQESHINADSSDVNSSETDEQLFVIKSLDAFPGIKQVLTTSDAQDEALRLPVEVRDFIIAVQIDSRSGRIYVDPLKRAQVGKFIPGIRVALSALGISSGGDRVYLADSSVIMEVRKSQERVHERKGGSIGTQGQGAQLFRRWISHCYSEKATDLHISIIAGGKARVQMRVNGEMEDLPGTSNGLVTEGDALNALRSGYDSLSDKNSNNQGTWSQSNTLSSMIDSTLGLPNLRVRFAQVRGLHGPKGVMRLLPSHDDGKGMNFEQMGFADDHIRLFERAQRMGMGAVGQMGVTGSGKTTAAKAFIETHPGLNKMAMYQVADPIELPIDGLHQIYVQRDLLTIADSGKKDAYSEVIESLLRMDPELVDVGEVRDLLSARAMANVAKSGHMAMFTLHTGSIQGAITRLTDPKIGLSREELTAGDMLSLLCYQSLVPVLCPHCKMGLNDFMSDLVIHKDAASIRELRTVRDTVEQLTTRFRFDPAMLRFRNHEGCEHCRYRGTSGLTIVAEVLMPETTWFDYAAKGMDREAMRWWRREYSNGDIFSGKQEGKLVMEHAMFKAYRGDIDPRIIETYGQLRALETIEELKQIRRAA
jgi:type II secretory ATPase GspE/PulE/Tfp pilus assembly ATPase PilB-like protein